MPDETHRALDSLGQPPPKKERWPIFVLAGAMVLLAVAGIFIGLQVRANQHNATQAKEEVVVAKRKVDSAAGQGAKNSRRLTRVVVKQDRLIIRLQKAGVNGLDGLNGNTGRKGDPGEPGITGAAGKPGLEGPVGPQGVKGDIGPEGPQGAPGQKGDTGPEGPKGETGPAGVPGATGPAGADGAPGVPGANGITPTMFTFPGGFTPGTPFTCVPDPNSTPDHFNCG